MVSVVERDLLVKFHFGDTLVVLDVASHKGGVVLDGGCSDEDIKITNNRAFSSQFPSNTRKLLCMALR